MAARSASGWLVGGGLLLLAGTVVAASRTPRRRITGGKAPAPKAGAASSGAGASVPKVVGVPSGGAPAPKLTVTQQTQTPPKTTTQALPPPRVTLSTSQRAMANLIAERFQQAGYSLRTAMAAVVNAWAESRLGARPVSPPPEDSIGLFQLNSAPNAAGAGMTYAQRMDPEQNIRRILDVIAGPSGARLRAADRNQETPARLAAIFCEDIERPENRVAKGQERAAVALAWWA